MRMEIACQSSLIVEQDVSYDLSRYTPELKDIGQQIIENKLSRDDFPYDECEICQYSYVLSISTGS